jgi:cation transport ATPase
VLVFVSARLRSALAPQRLRHTLRLLVQAPNRVAIAFVAITLGLLFVGVIVERFSATAALPIWALAYFTGGWFSLRTTLRSLRQRKLDVDLLMLIAAAGAAAVGAYWEGTVLLFLFSLGHMLEHRAMDRARRAVESLEQQLEDEQNSTPRSVAVAGCGADLKACCMSMEVGRARRSWWTTGGAGGTVSQLRPTGSSPGMGCIR